jgi:hypothetical protein
VGNSIADEIFFVDEQPIINATIGKMDSGRTNVSRSKKQKDLSIVRTR